MKTIFKINTIAGIIAYTMTNYMVNNSPHGWEGVLAGAIISGIVASFMTPEEVR